MAIYRNLVRSASASSLRPKDAPGELIRVFVGHEHQEFQINRVQLCAASSYFADKLRYMDDGSVMYLPRDSPAMFELFAAWVHSPHTFRAHLDEAITTACAAAPPDPGASQTTPSQRLHWALVRLHLFASTLSVAPLQDAAMDAIQDLYLRRDWDVTPRFIAFLYAQCTPASSLRLRRWAVAMVTYALSSPTAAARSADAPRQFQALLREHNEFSIEYAGHLRKMSASGLDARVKNPQLRIPANRLRNEERRFAFRQCAFHTHRASVGEGRCPHEVAALRRKRMPVLGLPLPFVIEEEKGWWSKGVEVPRPLKTRALSGMVF